MLYRALGTARYVTDSQQNVIASPKTVTSDLTLDQRSWSQTGSRLEMFQYRNDIMIMASLDWYVV